MTDKVVHEVTSLVCERETWIGELENVTYEVLQNVSDQGSIGETTSNEPQKAMNEVTKGTLGEPTSNELKKVTDIFTNAVTDLETDMQTRTGLGNVVDDKMEMITDTETVWETINYELKQMADVVATLVTDLDIERETMTDKVEIDTHDEVEMVTHLGTERETKSDEKDKMTDEIVEKVPDQDFLCETMGHKLKRHRKSRIDEAESTSDEVVENVKLFGTRKGSKTDDRDIITNECVGTHRTDEPEKMTDEVIEAVTCTRKFEVLDEPDFNGKTGVVMATEFVRFLSSSNFEYVWVSSGKPDAIQVSTNQNVKLLYVLLYPLVKGNTEVELSINEGARCLLRCNSTHRKGKKDVINVKVVTESGTHGLILMAHKYYDIIVKMIGGTHYGVKGQAEVTVDGVKFTFRNSPQSLSQTTVTEGQIAGLNFTTM